MRWSVFPAIVCIATCQEFAAQVHNHPAAGPDVTGLLARNLDAGKTLEDNAGRPEALIDPSGREFIAPLKQKAQIIEEKLRHETEEITRLLTTTQSRVTPTVCLLTLFGCTLVVLCGVLPALLLPANSNEYLATDEGKRNLNMLLSFAVGSLLGDVFLHILPATWSGSDGGFDRIGLCTMGGLLTCLFIEKLCSTTEKSQRKICAIMNLVANLVDNFTHGLAVGASFLVSPKFGMMTTFAILVHEIPHEVSDFAILLRGDFNRIEAVKAQLVTASGGVFGAFLALWMNTDNLQSADWILPFTAGGFINIALAQILPELNQEKDRRQNFNQIALMFLGLFVMIGISSLHIV
ncbi:ZIP Zinc transporter [Trichostrongylus colubriformis]|uniref:ZIP Zinc transporter n=1 Tax=Trichostrongylus colubriformis TaxID=6319 RepID=A0AAN8FGE4_TRICO